MMVLCIDCEEPIELESRPTMGQRLICPHCDAELEVVDTAPLELDWAFDEPEEGWQSDQDWDDDEDEDSDDEEWDEDSDDEEWDDEEN
jgi:lysine biosynthesis protein LysW